MLDIGSKNRRYDFLLKEVPTAIDIVEDKNKNVQYGDVNNLLFPKEAFSSVICLEVLEYVSTPERAIGEIHRVLRDGGIVVFSTPFLFKVHEDKMRYTAPYLRELFSRFHIKEFHTVGGSYTAFLTIVWGKIKSIRFLPLRYFCTALLLPLLSFLRRPTALSEKYASGYFIVAQKRYE